MARGDAAVAFLPLGGRPIDLRKFGPAAGDGSDASAAIAAAMASTGSPTIQIGAGIYGLLPGTYTAGSNVSLIGAGASTTTLRLTASQCNQVGSLLAWTKRNNIILRGFTLDLNGCVANGLASALAITGGSFFRFERVHIINMGAGKWLEASINGASHGLITESYFHARAAQTTQNQAINVSPAFGQPEDWQVIDNVMVNTGNNIDATRLVFAHNNISGWSYGAALSTNQVASPDSVISNNVIHDSGRNADSDNTWPNGLEIWGPRANIAWNIIYNVAGGCIFVGGQNSRLTGNTVSGCGKRSDGRGAPGIQLYYSDAAINANGSVLLNNTVADDGTGTTTFGLADMPRVENAVAPLSVNTFAGAKGAVHIVGGTSTTGP